VCSTAVLETLLLNGNGEVSHVVIKHICGDIAPSNLGEWSASCLGPADSNHSDIVPEAGRATKAVWTHW
jgi:hypothetical protein